MLMALEMEAACGHHTGLQELGLIMGYLLLDGGLGAHAHLRFAGCHWTMRGMIR